MWKRWPAGRPAPTVLTFGLFHFGQLREFPAVPLVALFVAVSRKDQVRTIGMEFKAGNGEEEGTHREGSGRQDNRQGMPAGQGHKYTC